MRQFQDEGLNLSLWLEGFQHPFSPDPAAIEPVPLPVFWRQNQGSIHPVGPIFHVLFTTKTAVAIINTGFVRNFFG